MIALLFTKPRAGSSTWCSALTGGRYRVVAYAALMRDEYPPFRLDTGELEPRQPLGAATA